MNSSIFYILLIIGITISVYRKHMPDNNYTKYAEYLTYALLTIFLITQFIFIIFFNKPFLLNNSLYDIILAIILLILACVFKLTNTKNKYSKLLHELSNQFIIVAVMLLLDGNAVPLLN